MRGKVPGVHDEKTPSPTDHRVRLVNSRDVANVKNLNQPINAEDQSSPFQWDLDFKLSPGYNTTHDSWDKTEEDDNHTHTRLWSTFRDPCSIAPTSHTKTNWTNKFNLVDLEFGRKQWVNLHLTPAPHMGLPYSKIEHNLAICQTEILLSTEIDHIELTNDYRGVGICGRLDTTGHLRCSSSILRKRATSITYGKFDVDHGAFAHRVKRPLTKRNIPETHDSFSTLKAILDPFLRAKRFRPFCNCECGISASSGWGQHPPFHQNPFDSINPVLALENLTPLDCAQSSDENVIDQSAERPSRLMVGPSPSNLIFKQGHI